MQDRPMILAALYAMLAAGVVSGAALAHDLALNPGLPSHAHEEIHLALQHGPNFAETAIFARWGCGSGCTTGGIHDMATGAWFELPFAIHRLSGTTDDPFAFKTDSPLLMATGLCNEEIEGRFDFAWDGAALVPLDAQAERCAFP